MSQSVTVQVRPVPVVSGPFGGARLAVGLRQLGRVPVVVVVVAGGVSIQLLLIMVR